MTFRSAALLLVLSLSLLSCNDDCDNLDDVILGTWSSTSLGDGNFTFLENGTLNDPNNLLLEFEVNGIVFADKKWRVEGNDQLILRAESQQDPTQFGELTLDVTDFDCEMMDVSASGVAVTFDKM